MGNFFERKKIAKPKFGEFDLTKKSDLEACGLVKGDDSFLIRNEFFNKSLRKFADDLEYNGNPVGTVAEQLEKHFSTREISFLLAKSMLVEGLREEEEKQLKEKKSN